MIIGTCSRRWFRRAAGLFSIGILTPGCGGTETSDATRSVSQLPIAVSPGDSGPKACLGTQLTSALVTDFSESQTLADRDSHISFGTASNVAGGTYAFAAPGLVAPILSLSSTVGNPRLAVSADTGIPTDASNAWTGFGMYFDRCVDASAYDAVAFTVRGNLGNCSLSFSVGFSEDLSVADSASLGACTSASCSPPASFTSWAGPIDDTLVIPFSKIGQWGSPVDLVDPHAVTGIAWNLSAPLGGSCVADFFIDDVRFVRQAHHRPRGPNPPGHTWFGGVNLASAAFGDNVPGQYGVDYIYPSSADVEPFLADHMNVFRLPFRWARLQHELHGELDAEEFRRLDGLVRHLTGRGAVVVLDPHDFARYQGQVVGVDVDASVLADFWGRLARRYRMNSRVIFGLMNEPSEMRTEVWLADANAALAAIRRTGASNLVLVPGNCWTGASCWSENWYGTPNATALLGVADPANNFAFEVHQYFDKDLTGNYATLDPNTGSPCSSPTIGSDRLAGFIGWARAHRVRAFLGEFGSSADALCLRALDDLLETVDANRDVFMGWTYWAAGPWWGDDNLNVQPNEDGTDKPQMSILKRHLDRWR